MGTFILTQKEVALLANVRDSEHLQKGNLPIDKSRLSGLSVRIKQYSVWRWETRREKQEEEKEEKVGGGTKRWTFHFNSQGFAGWKL